MQEYEYDNLTGALLLRDADFARKWGNHVLKHLDATLGHYAMRDLVSWGLEYHRKHGELIPEAALRMEVSTKIPQTALRPMYLSFIDTMFSRDLSGRPHVEATLTRKTLAREFEILPKPASGDPAEIREYIDSLRKLVPPADRDSLPKLVSDVKPPAGGYKGLSTGFPGLDAILDGGGICPGELGVVQGGPGIGKTRFLLNLARRAALGGTPTLYVSYEVSEDRLRQRVEKMLGADAGTVFGPPPKPVLCIKYSPGGPEYGADRIMQDVDELQARLGCKFGLVVRDYGELCVPEFDEYKAVSESYRQFRDALGERKIVGWDAMQQNRFGDPSFFNILKPADVILALQDGGETHQTVFIAKNREGPRGGHILLAVDGKTGVLNEYVRRAAGPMEE